MKKVILLCTLALMATGAIQGMERKQFSFGLRKRAKPNGAVEGLVDLGRDPKYIYGESQGYTYTINRSTPEQEQKDIAEMEKQIAKKVHEDQLKLKELQKMLQQK